MYECVVPCHHTLCNDSSVFPVSLNFACLDIICSIQHVKILLISVYTYHHLKCVSSCQSFEFFATFSLYGCNRELRESIWNSVS